MSKKSSHQRVKQPAQHLQSTTPTTSTTPSPRQPRQIRERVVVKRERTNILWVFAVIAVLLVAIAGIGIWTFNTRHNASARAGNEVNGTPVNSLVHPNVDNISCDLSTPAYTAHAHLTLYVNGSKVAIPQNIGVPSDNTCGYWIQTPDATGVLQIKAPKKQSYVLGTFVDLWAQQFPQLEYPVELSQSDGWQAWIDGKPYSGNFRNIPLTAHTVITLAYNSPNVKPDVTYKFPAGD